MCRSPYFSIRFFRSVRFQKEESGVGEVGGVRVGEVLLEEDSVVEGDLEEDLPEEEGQAVLGKRKTTGIIQWFLERKKPRNGFRGVRLVRRDRRRSRE